MKSRIPLLTLFSLATISLTSCSNPTEPNTIISQESGSPLAKSLRQILNTNAGKQGEAYIIYNSAANEYMTLTPLEYEAAQLLVRRAPNGPGWKYVGSGKGELAAMAMIRKIASTVEANRDFEVHVEYDKDGTFRVWYRYI